MRDDVDSRFGNVDNEFRRVRTEMKSGFGGVRQEFINVRGEMNAGFDGVRQEFSRVRSEMKTGLDEARGEMKAGFDELRRHMLVLHEETIDRIATLAFDPTPLRREFQAGDAAVRENINARLEPIEAAVRAQPARKKLKPRR